MNLQSHLHSLLLMAVCAAGIGACAQEANTTVARSVEEGDRIEKSWVRTWSDRARFECTASSTGPCAVVVFVTECPGPACKTRVLREFSLGDGAAADLAHLPPGFRYCLSHLRKPVAPGCTNV